VVTFEKTQFDNPIIQGIILYSGGLDRKRDNGKLIEFKDKKYEDQTTACFCLKLHFELFGFVSVA